VAAFSTGLLPEQVSVSVCDPALLRSTLRLGSRPIQLFQFVAPLLGDDNLQVYDARRAKETRRVLSSVLAHRHLASSYDDLLAHALALMEDLQAKSDDGAVMGLQNELLCFALRSALSVFAGETVSTINMDAFQAAYDTALTSTFDAQFGSSSSSAYASEVQPQEQLDAALLFLRDTVDSVIAAKRSQLIKNGPSLDREDIDLVELLCTTNDPDTKWPYDQDKIRSLLLTYVLAAYHTSVVATTWALYLLTQHPDAQAKVQREVDAVLKGLHPSLADLDQLTYTTQVLKESMRIYTPGPFGARIVENAEGLILGPHRLPAGCTVLYPLGVIHMHPEFWPEPSRFDPDRFAPGNNILPLTFVPFGLGPRICPGERMAWMEMRLLLALVMQRFTVELATAPDSVIPEELFVLWARDDIRVRLTPRRA
jgi:cytochrome P450